MGLSNWTLARILIIVIYFITSDFTSHLEILSIDSLVLVFVHSLVLSTELYLTIIPRARMGSESESIAHEVESQMDYWLRGHEGERNYCFSEVQLVGQKYRDKTTLAS